MLCAGLQAGPVQVLKDSKKPEFISIYKSKNAILDHGMNTPQRSMSLYVNRNIQ